MSSRGADAAAIVTLSMVLTVVMAGPVLWAPSQRIFGAEIVGRHHDPFTVMEQFGRPLARSLDLQPLTDLPGALVTRLVGPVAAYNAIVLLTFPLSALTAFLLARYLGLPRPASALAALAFAFSPFHLAQSAYHPHIAQTQWIPLFFLALWRCLDRADVEAVAILALAVAGVTLSNLYGGLIAAVLTPIAVAAQWLTRGQRDPSAFRRLAITAAALAVIAAAGVSYASRAAHAPGVPRTGVTFARADLFQFSAKWWSYLVPPLANPLVGRFAGRLWTTAGVPQAAVLEQQVSLGWSVAALAVVAIIARARKSSLHAGAAVPVLAAVGVAALVCSLSPERIIGPITFTRPSAWLYPLVPMFRAYARFGVVVQLMAALLAAIGADWLWRAGTRQARVICVALLSLAALEYTVSPAALWRDVLPTRAHRWIAGQPGALRVLDCAPLTADSQSVRWLSGSRIVLLTEAFDDCAQPNLGAQMAANRFTHLLVRRRTAEGRWFAEHGRTPGLELAARFPDGEVLTVTAGVPDVYTAAMTGFYAREHDASSSWRWMASEGTWTLVNSRDWPAAGWLDVEMTAFARERSIVVMLDGRTVQTVRVTGARTINRIGPLSLTTGEHTLALRPQQPADRADAFGPSTDRRLLSVAIGRWHWVGGGDP